MSPQVTALLCCLIIGIGTVHSAAVKKTRFKRADTRDIPSNMFKPLNQASQGNQNASLSDDYQDLSLSEHTTGEAHVVTIPPIQNRRVQIQNSEEDDYDQFEANRRRFYNSIANANRPRPPMSSFGTNIDRSSPRFGNSRFNGPQFHTSGSQFGPSGSQYGSSGSQFGSSGFEYGPSGSNLGQTIPLIGSGYISPDPFGPSSSSNFYRSESYSYSSDGNGPPQVERNVYDSRLGHGFSSRNF
ncbi:corneodesmosin [Drosophila sulfurigaster albostrigata]|uniref:corneodesmosin n=1 Tax=Drosophila sulfurigaster albostrigata TaxID=89887 RepID=UPI002D21DBBC|nr:corneodesmosin [Drosophila sulfurigaster albostrigata]